MNELISQFLPGRIALTPDTVIIGGIVFLILVGLFASLERIRQLALSVYVGLVLASSLGVVVFTTLAPHGLNFSLDRVKLILFILPILLLSITHAKAKHKNSNTILTLILAVLVGALIVSSVFLLLGASGTSLLQSSMLATVIYQLRLVWLAAVPAVAVVASMAKGKKGH
jgi:hypothetical protein